MRRLLSTILLSVGLAHGAGAVPAAKVDATTVDALRTALGSGAKVVEVNGGEAVFDLPYLKRVDVAKDTALLTVRNEGKVSLAPRLELEFFNAYGMLLCEVAASLEAEPVPAGGVGAKQVGLSLPELDHIFAASVIALPSDWKLVRFVAVKTIVSSTPKVPLSEGASDLQNGPSDSFGARLRPQIVRSIQSRPAIFEENKVGRSNAGLIGVSAQFSNYGAYLQKMIEVVQAQFDRLNEESRIYPPSGSIIIVKFILNDEGNIARIVSIQSKATEAAAKLCTSAITIPSPYGPWTDDMKAVLGKEQELTYEFFYR